jgi:hypothetical protein
VGGGLQLLLPVLMALGEFALAGIPGAFRMKALKNHGRAKIK